jgi:lysyl-tRNA synthetase class 2
MSEQQAQGADEAIDLNNELKTRREKLAALREQGVAFPNDFRRDHTSDQLHAEFDAKDNDELASLNVEVAVAGRMMTRRVMGKASFVTFRTSAAAFSCTSRAMTCRKASTTNSLKMGPRRHHRRPR